MDTEIIFSIHIYVTIYIRILKIYIMCVYATCMMNTTSYYKRLLTQRQIIMLTSGKCPQAQIMLLGVKNANTHKAVRTRVQFYA